MAPLDEQEMLDTLNVLLLSHPGSARELAQIHEIKCAARPRRRRGARSLCPTAAPSDVPRVRHRAQPGVRQDQLGAGAGRA